MKFIKRHWLKLALIVIFLIMIVVGIYAVLKFLYPDSRKDVYGNRLIGIEDVQIDDKTIKEIKEKISSSEVVLETDYVLKGKLINFTIYVNNGTDKNTSKLLVNYITETFSKEIQEFYDIQVLIIEDTEDSESTNYPIFAYKHKTNDTFVWTNN